jgi:hypothetical protein
VGKAAFSWFDQAAARIIRHSGCSSSNDAAMPISSAQNGRTSGAPRSDTVTAVY